MGYEFFTEKTKATQICIILYPENFKENWRDSLDSCPYGFYMSQVHTPDNKDKKQHRHCVIKDLHGHFLKYEKVFEWLNDICDSPPRALVLWGGLKGLKDYTRYCLHLERPDKEQFDQTNPLYMDDTLPDNGIVNGKLNIFDDKKGFVCGNGLDYLQLSRFTVREMDEIKRSYRDDERAILIDYIFKHKINDFASFAEYAFKCGFSSFWSDSGLYYRIIQSIKERDDMKDKGHTINYAEKPKAQHDIILANKAQIIAYIASFASTCPQPVVEFVIEMADDKLKTGISQLEMRRIFMQYVDPLTFEPRRYYKADYDTFLHWRDAI